MKPNLNPFVIALLCTVAFNYCFALSSDRQQPARMKADSADINNKSGINHYYGHVQFEQGTTHIRADYGKTKVNKQNQLVEAIAKSKSKQLAHYQTQPKPNEDILHARAKTIIWYPLQEKVTLIGDARITQGKNSYRAPHIDYDIANEHVISKPSKQGRTTIMFYPEKKTS